MCRNPEQRLSIIMQIRPLSRQRRVMVGPLDIRCAKRSILSPKYWNASEFLSLGNVDFSCRSCGSRSQVAQRHNVLVLQFRLCNSLRPRCEVGLLQPKDDETTLEYRLYGSSTCYES
ncbi:hypothetical protein HW555_011614 [Spodoptera exigua]|uniref:Uncharacterized protein n=1 Tax=Spodoptera exigua TaxID=7107 RepID=A0A835G6R3_SPOEX|nr:hypothetical protein HW555_011614 [Spodoptera exigua]